MCRHEQESGSGIEIQNLHAAEQPFDVLKWRCAWVRKSRPLSDENGERRNRWWSYPLPHASLEKGWVQPELLGGGGVQIDPPGDAKLIFDRSHHALVADGHPHQTVRRSIQLPHLFFASLG
jgi:hypothetical protein